jgi:hypothetical protein
MARDSTVDLRPGIVLANRMTALIVGARGYNFEHVRALKDRETMWLTREVDVNPIQLSQLGVQLAAMANVLDVLLSKAGYEKSIDEAVVCRFGTGEEWSLGTEFRELAPHKMIHGDKDLLHRDTEFGVHYHYALANGERTTTMICWDTRWVSGDSTEPKGLKLRPIFHELHGEGRYKKTARPQVWGDEKRKSVRDACVPDLQNWDVEKFRCASNNAVSVWPLNASLTPRQLASQQKKK